MSETVFLTEDLPDGIRREWLQPGHKYAGTVEQRADIVRAITAMWWHRAGEPIAMMPGLLLQAIVDELEPFGVKQVAQRGYSTHPIEFPDCSCSNPHHPDHFATYQLVGMKVRHKDGWWTCYWLDIGTGAVGVVSDFAPAPVPDGVTEWCAMEWHDDCRRRAQTRDDRLRACACSCHGQADTLANDTEGRDRD